MQEKFMARAIEIARESVDTPGTLPYGAVVVKDGKIIGEGLNRSYANSDPTSHGEVEAIRDACKRLSVTSLKGADLYTSGEPCSMCVAAMYQVGIARLYYAGEAADSAAFFQRLAAHDPKWARSLNNQQLRQQVGLPVGERDMVSQQMMREDILAVYDAFADRHTS
ncbi:MAG: nucleoside deaminase [Rhodospirillaceae bacterium]|nr:nucleoside deaminase [Rhodospirillaceae bacterium]MDD9915781.1 nucleoside deaminase [Rhodospirillaceae bacterium]MDD9926052.1 nucleoside deaminase [Rhodospirillaceae bacterium]